MAIEVKKSTPARTRTLDPVIKSHLLYQLSYEGTFVRGDSRESALRPKDDRNPLSECRIVASNGSLARATFLGKLPGDWPHIRFFSKALLTEPLAFEDTLGNLRPYGKRFCRNLASCMFRIRLA